MKRKAAIFTSVFLGCLFSLTGQCQETFSYSDQYVSFEYTDDVNCEISCFGGSNDVMYYNCSTAMKEDDPYNLFAAIRIINISYYEELLELEDGTWKDYFFSNQSSTDYNTSIISEGDLPEIKTARTDGSDSVQYSKLLGYTERDFVVATCLLNESLPEISDLCKVIYDSAAVSDYYLENGYTSEDDYSYDTIYSNVLLSEQAINYANAAIDILEKYLAFEIDADSASEQIEDIRSRSEDYSESSEYKYDSKVDSALYTTGLSIDMGSDSAVLETLQELKQLVDSTNE